MSVETLTFGCRLNIVESDIACQHAQAAGATDTIIVNTCAVTAEAGRQARKAIRKLARERPRARIVVTGCGAEVEQTVYASMPEVARLIGNAAKLRADTWTESEADTAPGSIMSETTAAASRLDRITAHTRAFVAVQNGCDHRCTFCVIPFGRGPSRSVRADEVVAQVRQIVEHGGREVVLTGVDLTAYGRDLGPDVTLGRLVQCILRAVPDLPRLRLSSVDSVEADHDLLDAFATEPRLMPHLHLSLQAGDDLVLKRMKRRHTRDDAIRFCETLRGLRPGIVFGADLIAGFPTETEEQFAQTVGLVQACGLTHLHVFPYSIRPETPAARMPQVDRSTIHRRAAELRSCGAEQLQAHLDTEVGQTRTILAERGGMGRTEAFTLVALNQATEAGTIVDATITGHDGHRLTIGN